MSWRIGGLLGEGIRNVFSSPIRTLLLLVVVAGTAGSIAYVELATTGELIAFNENLESSGKNVFVAHNDGGLSSGLCANLANEPGVIESAAIRPGTPVDTTKSPATLFQTATMTVGGFRLLTGQSPTTGQLSPGLVIGSSAAEELGVRPGMWLQLATATPSVVRDVIGVDSRDPQASRWIFMVTPPVGSSVECWVEYEPGVETGRTELLETVFSASGDTLSVRPLIRIDKFTRDPASELKLRPQATAWIVVGLVLAGLSWLSDWFRRSEIGLYRAVGTGSAALFFLSAAEYAIAFLIGSTAGLLWATTTWVVIGGRFPTLDQINIATRTTLSAALLAAMAAPIASLVLARGSISRQLKER